jgi:hypothetical protein
MSAILHEQAVDRKGCGLVSQEHPATDIVWCAAEVLPDRESADGSLRYNGLHE